MLFWLLSTALAQAPVPLPGQFETVKNVCNKVAREFAARCANRNRQDDQTWIYSDCGTEVGKFTLKLNRNPTVDDYALKAPRCEVQKEVSRKILSLTPNSSVRTIYTPFGTKIVEQMNENGNVTHVEISNTKGSTYSYGSYVPSRQAHDALFTSLTGVPEKVEPPAAPEQVTKFIKGLVEDLRAPVKYEAPAQGTAPAPDAFK